MALLNSLEQFVKSQHPDVTYWIGLSGGVDSLSLLHALVALRRQYPLRLQAIHVNHNLHVDAPRWVSHCETVCREWDVPFVTESVLLGNKNIEESAREARYAVFANYLQSEDVLLTAHHQDDQAETVLLQLLRGAGPKGLSAMPLLKPFGKGVHARPLLSISREEILGYAESNQLQWIEDPSNANTDLTRNFLRQSVLPVLQERWPSAAETLTRVAENCRDTQMIIEEVARQDVLTVLGTQSNTLSLSKLSRLSGERQRQALRTWLHDLGFSVPNQKKLLQLQKDFLTAAQDRFPHVSWDDVELRRHGDDLYAMPCLPEWDASQVFSWDLAESLSLPHVTLKAQLVKGQGLKQQLENISVRFRQGGEACQLQGKTFTQDLKKIFQEKNVPMWERCRTPLIFVGDKLAAAMNLFVAAEFAAALDEMGWVVEAG